MNSICYVEQAWVFKFTMFSHWKTCSTLHHHLGNRQTQFKQNPHYDQLFPIHSHIELFPWHTQWVGWTRMCLCRRLKSYFRKFEACLALLWSLGFAIGRWWQGYIALYTKIPQESKTLNIFWVLAKYFNRRYWTFAQMSASDTWGLHDASACVLQTVFIGGCNSVGLKNIVHQKLGMMAMNNFSTGKRHIAKKKNAIGNIRRQLNNDRLLPSILWSGRWWVLMWT